MKIELLIRFYFLCPNIEIFDVHFTIKVYNQSNVVEEFIRDVDLGSGVKIIAIADRTKEYTGKVMFISQIAFNNNGETVIPVKISIDNLDSFLLPNYNVDVFIDVIK